MLEDFRLKVFMTVAESGSFTKAAEILGVSQPAVSQNIAELEKKTGVRLFERLRREVVLTKAGKAFLKYALKIIEAYADADMMFAQIDQRVVKIAVSEEIYTTYLLPILDDYLTFHPEISIIPTHADDYDISMNVVPAHEHGRASSISFDYKPTQAFALTKTCLVLKDILGF